MISFCAANIRICGFLLREKNVPKQSSFARLYDNSTLSVLTIKLRIIVLKGSQLERYTWKLIAHLPAFAPMVWINWNFPFKYANSSGSSVAIKIFMHYTSPDRIGAIRLRPLLIVKLTFLHASRMRYKDNPLAAAWLRFTLCSSLVCLFGGEGGGGNNRVEIKC